jgi:hypothetical protein
MERPEGNPLSRTEGDQMSDQERETVDEAEDQPAGEEPISDLKLPEEEAEAVKGGVQDPEYRRP